MPRMATRRSSRGAAPDDDDAGGAAGPSGEGASAGGEGQGGGDTASDSAGEAETSDGESDEEGYSSASSEEVPMNVAERPTRSTAGISRVVREGKALEDHEQFWGHKDWAEGSSTDSSFNKSEHGEDDGDSWDTDIDTDEEQKQRASEEQAEEERQRLEAERAAAEEDAAARRRKLPQIPGRPARARPSAGWSPASGVAAAAKEPLRRRLAFGAALKPKAPMRPPPALRSSTQRQRAEREARAAAQPEPGAAGTGGTRRRSPALAMTQQERLEEAAFTEIRNLDDLKAKRNLEVLAKFQALLARQRRRYRGPRVRFVSRLLPAADPEGAVGAGTRAGGRPHMVGGRPGVESYLEFIDCGLPGWLTGGVSEVVASAAQPAAAKRPRVATAVVIE